jgi:hypothetical protein
VTYPVNSATIGRRATAAEAFLAGRLGHIRMYDGYCPPSAVQSLYNDVPAQIGTASSHWHFYQADAAEGTTIAGQGVDAPNIVVDRSSKVRQRWNIKRNGSTLTNAYFHTECNVNGGTFTQLTNSCATFPVCVAADSSKNMGDLTSDLGLPNDGFNFVAGRFVVDTINTGFTTTIPDGGVSWWETGYAFGASLIDEDVVRCRLRTAAAVFDSYPSVLPTITIDVPVVSSTGKTSGGKSSGGGRK